MQGEKLRVLKKSKSTKKELSHPFAFNVECVIQDNMLASG